MGGMRQTSSFDFIDFKLEVINISKSNLKCIKYRDGNDNAVSKIAMDLTKDTLMQKNVKQRLVLQREIGNITSFVNGKSMSQLRSDKNKKEGVELCRKLLT